MRHSFSKSLAIAVAMMSVLIVAKTARSVDRLGDLSNEIDSWHLKEARKIADELNESSKNTPGYQYLLGRLLLHEGDYSGALNQLRGAIEGARAELGWKMLRDLCAQSEAVLNPLSTTEGGSGSFLYRHKEGRDGLLVPYAEKILVDQLEALDEVLGGRPDFPVEIDILPDIESLAAASGLSVDQIDRTGTVAVTKYARIMIVSPRVLATGYPWLDTLAHELTHLVITRVSRNRAPIWLHEGIAKLYEQMWRQKKLGSLSPEEAYLLDRAARERRLIPLRRFHPSVAHLPNQEDAALAYAQVLSFSNYLHGKLGPEWAQKLLTSLGAGNSVDQAFASLSKFNVRRLYTWWRQEVSGKRQTPIPAVSLLERRYLRGEATGEAGLESALDVDVRRHLRVGDLLRLRGHIKSAIKEYRQAKHLAESPSPEISNRLGSCLLETERADEALKMLLEMAKLYPAHATVFVQLGRAHTMKNNIDKAISALEKANGINPFDPKVHCTLRDLYQTAGKTEDAKLEETHCRILAAGKQLEGDDP